MTRIQDRPFARNPRRDGWTDERRAKFFAALAGGATVRQACRFVSISHEAAYRLRRRDRDFAAAWDGARQAARDAALAAFLASVPEWLRRTLSTVS